MRTHSDSLLGHRPGRGPGGRPRGPQNGAVAVPGRRPAVLAPTAPTSRALVNDANQVGVTVVSIPLRRSWGILVRRGIGLQGRTTKTRRI
jgi:hypothetical protein